MRYRAKIFMRGGQTIENDRIELEDTTSWLHAVWVTLVTPVSSIVIAVDDISMVELVPMEEPK